MAKKAKKKTSGKLIGFTGLIAFLAVLFGFTATTSPGVTDITPIPLPTQSQINNQPIVSDPSSKCHINGVLPDPTCTPGSIDPNVTQANIQQTICKSGYTATVRPPVSYTNNLKIQQIAEYGFEDTDLRDYEEDHLISLELGGAPKDPKNLWPEPGKAPNPKDKIENRCHKKVCNGEITLERAQHEIAANWPTACR